MEITQENLRGKHRLFFVLTVIKYICSAALTLLAMQWSGQWGGAVAAYAELAAIFCLSNMILRRVKIPGWIVNGLLMLFYNAQMLVLLFGGTFISLVMLTNLDSLEDLGGKAAIYAFGVVFVLIISFIPICYIDPSPLNWSGILSAVLAVELVFTMTAGSGFSPFYAYRTLTNDSIASRQLTESIEGATEDETHRFWSNEYYNYRKKPADLPEKPNIVIILTEGLSQNVIDDPRNMMLYVDSYQKKALSFDNYYNHTFATYRGIIGQLYSGYQLNNYDTNSLVSLQEVFGNNGYHTEIINTEPFNLNFAGFLENLNFDEVVTNTEIEGGGISDTLTDKQAYEILYDEISAEHQKGKPFMTVIYTFGTHVSLDSPDERFGDGSDRFINKFYNLDWQFGEFMKKFEASGMSEDTIIVFTADHCTYADADFSSTFPDVRRAFPECDSIPFFIYYKGIEPDSIDVNGRNSLDFAPTVLDFLDIHAENYFLGVTLFADDQTSANMSSFDRIFSDSSSHVSTKDAKISQLSDVQKGIFEKEVHKYYIAKSQERKKQS